MEQRRLRLGDILDDYCTRERRLANHVVVAMVGDEVKQTRCTTCDAEHPYKGGRVPARRKKDVPAALVKPGVEATIERPRLNGDHAAAEPVADAPSALAASAAHPVAGAPEVTSPDAIDANAPPEDGPVHRQLIRATLPRVEGEVKERPIPEFTMRMVRTAGRGARGGGRHAKGGRAARQAAANFSPGVMSSWSPSNPRPRGGDPQHAGRPAPRAQGNKKPR